jgi:hypothetical protein
VVPVCVPSSRIRSCVRAAASPRVTPRRAVSCCAAAAWGQGYPKP